MRLRLYIVSICLCLSTVRAVAFDYGTQAPTYTMRSTSASHMTSMCRTTNELVMVGNTSGHFSTYVYGVGEDFASPAKLLSRPRRVDENDSEEEPGGKGNPGPIGDIPWLGLAVFLLLYVGYIARRQKPYRAIGISCRLH